MLGPSPYKLSAFGGKKKPAATNNKKFYKQTHLRYRGARLQYCSDQYRQINASLKKVTKKSRARF